MTRLHTITALLLSASWVTLSPQASAREEQTYQFDLPVQPVGDSLRAVAARAGLELYAPADAVNAVTAPALHATLSARQAIERLLTGTGLSAQFTEGAVTIRGRPQAAATDEAAILVTGSRIRGAPPAAPVTKVTSQDMRRAGQADLGEAIRSNPLNFAGGQNPGIGNTQGSTSNVNVNGASSVNLLGLGPSATLTLLNGGRLSYTGLNAAVDIDAIPASAVDRMEIIADGSSAVYGADAVAGVVNVVLKRDYDGLEAQAGVGGATDGGYFRQQYGVVAGKTWDTGSLLAVYDYMSNSGIDASQRGYASTMASDGSLYPPVKRHNALVSIHQEITSDLSASVDLLYRRTQQVVRYGYVAGRSSYYSGGDSRGKNPAFTIAPSLEAKLGHDWIGRIASSYSIDRSRFVASSYSNYIVTSKSDRQYDNSSFSIEVGADGPLFDLPAGPVRIALGGGYRRTKLDFLSASSSSTTEYHKARENRFGYVEAFVPVISPEQDASFARSISITGAFRYESNTGTSSVAVPKLAIAYAPIEGLTLKGSWGRSFRLPTIYEQYNGYAAVLIPMQYYATGYPSGSNFIYLNGSNPALKPERSENWTLSAQFQPSQVPGLIGSLSYFHFNYKDRIAQPVTSVTGAFDNPLYSSFITTNPSEEFQSELIAGANSMGLQNITGSAYDPSSVVAVLDNRYQNVAREIYRGLAASVRYSLGDLHTGKLDLSLDGLWLSSRRQLSKGAATTQLAGTLFNPPRLKGRLGLTYSTDRYALSGFANISSKLTDRRKAAAVYSIDGLRTFDVGALVKAGDGLEFSANVNNVFNAKPPVIVTSSVYDTPFDTLNYSAIGRFISVRVRKSW